ncbi:hypothetical protein V6N12_029904 [Hibiscus sabdariffa]|uniref:NB-ARC domain-containing protein n=1 Tax=Hibiscus sabdariffa TaxID=183260 RepID=A0ABR2D059_9ROSI
MGNCLPLSCAVDAILICCCDFISGPKNYISHLEQNLDALDQALEHLKALQEDVLCKVELAVKELLKPLNRVQGWLSRTTTLIAEADKLLEYGDGEKNKLCLGGYCSENCMSSCEYGKKVAKMLAEIKDHISEGDFETVAETEPTVLVEIGFSDDSWKNTTVDRKATFNHQFLRKKKFVLLMDDLWEPLDLTKVGIPIPTYENGSKVVFTTRFEDDFEAPLQGYRIINSLCSACLLESDGEGCVKMHDVVRDMALWITCELEAGERKFYAKAEVGLHQIPKI